VTRPLIIAHRTTPAFAPENSLAGIKASFEQGSDGVEIDVRMTLDQRPYLMHDNFMLRTTGWPPPMELTPAFWARTQRLEGTEQLVPSLAQALDALPEEKLIAADVKTPWSIVPLTGAVRRRGIAERTLVWCSSALVVKYALGRKLGWEVAHYKDYEDPPSNRVFAENAKRIGAHAVSLDWRAIDAELVTFAHGLGLKVYSWHKEYELDPSKLRAGLDGLITDYPAKAREAVTEALNIS
jgi:glycerophosphoryl diester phosphodiesterase